MRFTLPVLAALAIHPLDLAAQDQKPQAPGGFEWRQFGATKALLLVPDGCFVMEQTEKGTHAIFITNESIEDKGKYSTGMSVTACPSSSKETPFKLLGLTLPNSPSRMKPSASGKPTRGSSKVTAAL